MKLVRPFTVTEAALTASNVVETAPAAYNAGTTYATGATVSVATGTAIAVYRSLQNANTGNAPASSPSWWKLTGNTYALYNAGTTYADGDIVISATTHRTYESLQNSNLNRDPTLAANSAWWTDIGPTNRWSMFDGSVTSQTSNPESIEVTIQTTGRIDSLALLNVDAAEVTVTMTDSVEGQVFNETFSLVSPSGIIDWYAYFFEPIERLADLYIGDMPPYAGAEIEVLLDGAGSTARCGGLVLGLSKQIGETVYGSGVGIIDYSRKTVDTFGNFAVVERAFSKRANFTVNVPIGLTDQVQVLLSRYRAEPIVYVGSDRFGATLVYGFYKDFNVEIENPSYSVCNLQIEGLT